MTNQEIIDVVSAHEAGMRIQHRNPMSMDPTWHDGYVTDFNSFEVRVHHADAEKWERIKVGEAAEPELPPLPEGAVLLPVGFKRPEGVREFSAWFADPEYDYTWTWLTALCGTDPYARYAVKPDSEIARINGVGFGPCPSPHGWHNPDNLTPEQVGVPQYRLLARDEVGEREGDCTRIECLHSRPQKWDWNYAGSLRDASYRTTLPYGSLPPVTHRTFPECAPPEQDPDYGYHLDGTKIEPPNDDHEIIPEGTKMHPGEVTHWYGAFGWWTSVGDYPFPVPGNFRHIVGINGYVRAYARLKYSVLHERSGIKPGDTVEVTRAAESYERGWNDVWVSDQEILVGRRGNVVTDWLTQGFTVQFGFAKYRIPAFVLRKVERRKVPLDIEDFRDGPWVIRNTKTLHIVGLAVGVDININAIAVGNYCMIYQRELTNYERARGWPGDPDLEWKHCWKYDESEANNE